MWLLSGDIYSKHHAKKLEEGKIKPLLTRSQKENFRIHPAWVQRYVFIQYGTIRQVCMKHTLTKLLFFPDMQVEIKWTFTFRASG